MAETLTNPTACNFGCTSAFNANYDIVWSFQYSLCGPINASAGFTTFLWNTDATILTGGGIGRALCYGPSTNYTGFNNVSALSGAVLGIAFDTSGLFATTGNGFTTGTVALPNSLIIRSGMNYLSSVQLSAINTNFTLLSTAEEFNTLRFNLTNAGQQLKIALLDKQSMRFNEIYNVVTYLPILSTTQYRIGVSYASPVSGNVKAQLQVKDLHVHGTTNMPTTVYF